MRRQPALNEGLLLRRDPGDADSQLLGSGKAMRSSAARQEAVDILEEHLTILRQGQQDGDWQPGAIAANPTGIFKYVRAYVSRVGAIDSYQYSRTVTKQSFWLLVQYEVSGRVDDYVARAEYFLRVTQEGREDLRIAVCTLYRRLEMQGVLYVIRERRVLKKAYPVSLSSVVSTLVSCSVKDPRPLGKRSSRHTAWLDAADAGKVFFLRAANVSRFE